MSALSDGILQAFTLALEMGAGNVIKANGISKPCIATPVERTRDLHVTGFIPQSATAVQMLATDFDALKLSDRADVELDGVAMRVLSIQRDTADPLAGFLCQSKG